MLRVTCGGVKLVNWAYGLLFGMHVTVKKEHYPLPYHDHEWAQKKYSEKV